MFKPTGFLRPRLIRGHRIYGKGRQLNIGLAWLSTNYNFQTVGKI